MQSCIIQRASQYLTISISSSAACLMNSPPKTITVMTHLIAFLLSVFYCAITPTTAMQWDRVPSTTLPPSLGWNPTPTPRPLPVVDDGKRHDLLRRQVSANKAICGYINGAISGEFSIPVFTLRTWPNISMKPILSPASIQLRRFALPLQVTLPWGAVTTLVHATRLPSVSISSSILFCALVHALQMTSQEHGG
jgi:hypothetical protein